MTLPRFYCEHISEGLSELRGPEAHHLCSVLRLSAGERIELFDGRGLLATAVVKAVSGKKTNLGIEGIKHIAKRPGEIIIAVSFPKGSRFDLIVSKCTELGVDRIVPVIFERTVKQPKNANILLRWRKLAVSAAKQCGRVYLPEIDAQQGLGGVVSMLKKDYPGSLLLVGDVDAERSLLEAESGSNVDTIALVGPEGGISEEEKVMLKESGFEFVRISDTVLRVETAAICFASILSCLNSRRKGPKEKTKPQR